MCLDPGISGECVLGLFRFVEPKFPGGNDGDTEGCEQRTDLAQLARVVGRDDQLVAVEPAGHATAAFCASTRVFTPWSASAISCDICSWLKVAPSADICTSMS